MRDLNKVMLIGRLGADPEMRFTPSGSAVTSFRLATSRKGRNGDETEWHSIVAWDKLAEICNQYLVKGGRVYVEGRLQTRSWEDAASGQTRYRTEIVISDMIMLDGRDDRAASGDEEYAPPPPPAAPSPTRPAPNRGRGVPPPPPELGDDDIPF